MTETRLELGIRDSFFSGNPLKAGYHVGIDAEPTDVDVSQLWFDRGRLVKGARPESAVPYADHDYMVIEIERREKRIGSSLEAAKLSAESMIGSMPGNLRKRSAMKPPLR